MMDATPYTVPKEPGRWRALICAALVHAALLVFLWIGVQWQSETPVTIEAEVWSPQPREAAPQPEPPTETEAQPQPKPQPQPEVREPPKPKVEEQPEEKKPDIALEREKKRKEELKRRKEEEEKEEKLAKEKKRQEDEKKQRLEEEKRAKEKKLEEEKQKLAKLEKEKAEKAEKEKAEKAKKEAAEKKRKQEADDKLMAKMREEDMRRITGGVTGTGGNGDAPKSQGGRASAEYGNRIAAKIKSNITFIVPEGLQGNPPVEFEVRLLPDGSVAGMRKIRSSGVPGFDEAVARAIERSQPFPKDNNGTVPSSFTGIHKPKDQ